MSRYSKINIVYLMQKWMDSVPGQTFLNYAYSWGAAVVILGTLFKLTHLPGADTMLFLGMGTEVFVFFISAFDRPFDKSTIDMTLDNHMTEFDAEVSEDHSDNALETDDVPSANGGTVIIGGGVIGGSGVIGSGVVGSGVVGDGVVGDGVVAQPSNEEGAVQGSPITFVPQQVTTPAPAVSQETAEEMEEVTTAYVERLKELNDTLEKVGALSARLATDSEEMENLNRTLTGISRVYEMQLKSASQQITTQDAINEQTRLMAQHIKELNSMYARMIEAMTVNMGAARNF